MMAPAGESHELPPGPRLLILDGHAYAYRAFFAIRQLASPTGQPTNAIFGFISMLARLRAFVEPTHLAVIWDGGLSPERLEALPGYKAERPPMPESLDRQIDAIGRWLAAAQIASCQHAGVEADDWIAALASRATDRGWSTVIASSDKDFMQLVSDRVRLVNPGDKSDRFWGDAEVREKTGVEPKQIVDWLSLVGDSVDNIPGVRGVGPRTATNLLVQHGSISAIYSMLHQVTPDRIRVALAESESDVRRNQALIRLKSDLDPALGPDLDALGARSGNGDELIALCSEWGFRTLRRELERARSEPALLL